MKEDFDDDFCYLHPYRHGKCNDGMFKREIFSANNLENPTLEKDPSNGESGLHCFKKKGRYMGEFVLSTNHDLFLRDKQRRPMWEPRKGSRARPNESEGNE